MDLTIKKDRVLAAAESYPEAKGVLKELFPDAFEPEVHAEIGSVYSWFDDPFMIVRLYSNMLGLVRVDGGGFCEASKPICKHELKSYIEKNLRQRPCEFKYLGHRDDVLDITVKAKG